MIAERPGIAGTWRETTPRAAALRMLEHRFGPLAADAAPGGRAFELAAFQEDAVQAASVILARRRGVVLADSVGLGKTFIALALAERALAAGESVAVVAPAALRREWSLPLRRLADRCSARTHGLGAHAPSAATPAAAGDDDAPAANGSRAADRPPEVAWLSHTALSFGRLPPESFRPAVVIVDEAHAFRSPHTRRYQALAGLCRGARVVLVTATPVNNSLMDLYFQLHLFAGDGEFADVGVPDLRAAFRAAVEEPGAGDTLLPVLRAVVVRRTRPFLRRHYPDAFAVPNRVPALLRFPRRAPPIAVRYDLEAAYPGFFGRVASCLDGLALAPFRLGDYGAARWRGGGEAELLRLGLLKRLESGSAAFRASIARQLRYQRAFLSALERGRLLTVPDHRVLHGTGDEEPMQLVLEELALDPLPAAVDVARLRSALEADIEALSRLRTSLATLDAARDPKLAALCALLEGELAGRKVVVFTEFRDTARALWRALAGRGGIGLVDGAGAFLGRSPAGRRVVLERFAPRANGAREPPPRERVDLLIATDVLAEGLNLQDAAHVVSYDLPWNPVRLIQRVGRVDRLGSPHDVVHAYHFLPDGGLERLLGLVGRLRAKLDAIGRALGAEAPVLDPAEAPARDFVAYVQRLADGDATLLDDPADALRPASDADDRLFAAWLEARSEDGGAGCAGQIAVAAITAPAGKPASALVACEGAAGPLWLVVDPIAGTARVDDDDAATLLLAALRDRSPPGNGTARPAARTVFRALAVAGEELARRVASARTGGPLPAHTAAARAARTLLRALAAAPGDPDPEICRRADGVLDRLRTATDAATERAIAGTLRRVSPGDPAAFLAALEAALEPAGRSPGGEGERGDATPGTGAALAARPFAVIVAIPADATVREVPGAAGATHAPAGGAAPVAPVP